MGSRSRSCFSVVWSVLINLQCLLNRRVFQQFGVQIIRFKHQSSGIQQFRADDGYEELLQRHAIVGEESAQGEWERSQDTHPARGLLAQHGTQQQVNAHGQSHREQGAEELPGGQAEENAFLVLAYFFGNFDFDN